MKLSGLVLIFLTANCFAIVRTKTDAGLNISWKGTSSISMDVVTSSSDLSSADVQTIIGNSISEWNDESSLDISPSYVSSSSFENRIEFVSGGSAYLGAGVVAVTTVNFSNLSGKIKSAVIYINEGSYTFSNDSTDNPQVSPYDIYLGDVVTHEIGHLFGLGHSEVVGSSMNYSAFKGQHSLNEEDKSSIRSIYPVIATGTIKGRVIGGSVVPVFGAYVSAVSAKKGTIVGSALSDSNGDFSITGLEMNDDNYYLYIEPIKNKNSLPTYYSSAQSNFCPSDYVGSFFTSCGNDSKGSPQRISLTEDDSYLDVGDITIRCDLGVNTNYLSQKSNGSNTEYTVIEENSDLESNGGKSFVGYFYNSQVSNSNFNSSDWDILKFDLTDVVNPDDKKLKITVLNLSLGIPVNYYKTIVQFNNANVAIDVGSVDEVSEDPLSYPLDTIQDNNIFGVKIKPRSITTSTELKQTFPQPSVFNDDRYFYMVMIDIVNENDITELYDAVVGTVDDNYTCTEAPFTFGVAAVTSNLVNDEDVDLLSASCGTISGPNDSGTPGGPLSLVLGFILSALISGLRRSSKIV